MISKRRNNHTYEVPLEEFQEKIQNNMKYPGFGTNVSRGRMLFGIPVQLRNVVLELNITATYTSFRIYLEENRNAFEEMPHKWVVFT